MFKYRLKRCKFVSPTDEQSEGFDHRREQKPLSINQFKMIKIVVYLLM